MENEYCRLLSVKRYQELSLQKDSLNDIVLLAAEICESHVAVISLIDDTREYFIANKGTDMEGRLLNRSFCIKTILNDHVLTIPDVTKHKRFTNTDLGTVSPHMRFYAGATLTSPDGYNVGRLYVLDQKPKQLTKSQENCLLTLASQAINRLEQALTLQTLRESLKDEERLKQSMLKIKDYATSFF